MVQKKTGKMKPSFTKVVRDDLKLSQLQFSILLNIPISTIRNHEQKVRGVKSGGSPPLKTLLSLLSSSSKDIVFAQLLADVPARKYRDIKEVKAALSMIKNSDIPDLAKSALEMSLLISNKQFSAKSLGFKVTEISIPK